jgi:hypothetical protein
MRWSSSPATPSGQLPPVGRRPSACSTTRSTRSGSGWCRTSPSPWPGRSTARSCSRRWAGSSGWERGCGLPGPRPRPHSGGAAMVATIVLDVAHPLAVSTALSFAFHAGDELSLVLFALAATGWGRSRCAAGPARAAPPAPTVGAGDAGGSRAAALPADYFAQPRDACARQDPEPARGGLHRRPDRRGNFSEYLTPQAPRPA